MIVSHPFFIFVICDKMTKINLDNDEDQRYITVESISTK